MTLNRFKPGTRAYLEVEIAQEHDDGMVALVLPDGQRYLIGLGDAKALSRVVTDCGKDVEYKYIQGRVDGAKKGKEEGYADGYEKGLNDAWDAARKICLDGESGGASSDELKEIFGYDGYYHDIMQNVSADEAVAKIKDWEKKANEIHVGDVVENDGDLAVVLNIGSEWTHVLTAGTLYYSVHADDLKKTGRTVDVAGFLKQIGGAE